MGEGPTCIMVAVNESTTEGYLSPSISSMGAFDWTLQKIVRSNTSHFKIFLLHVQVSDENGFDDMSTIFTSPDDWKNMKHRDKATGHLLLQHFVETCHSIKVPCEAWIKAGGDPKKVICSEVKRIKPDLLVVGSRGLGPFQSFVGAVSEFCQKHAECPVVVIKRAAQYTPDDPIDD